ncbi:response regulator [Polaribacter vadi]|uniref:response regulator n=1 Tax=Polaribacter TaxID=52959 RepID=UPI001C0A362D|nr:MULTISPECIES: response regulator [Polaribacter]MBU3010120.1 response regulator [Polaribacter vadi]MDO6739927.1 response regulator [Polaribacter sp. 1_MG-2023]
MKFNNILLVDDDESTNRFHQIVINRLEITNKITFARNGKKALDYLLSKEEFAGNKEFVQPEFIIIDLNMPVMSGFRFVELYMETENFKKHKPKIIVLSTSLIPEEKEKIEANKDIFMFLNKPLTKDVIVSVLVGNYIEN